MARMMTKFIPKPLKPNALAPEFELEDQKGRKHSLAEYRGKWIILYFYPKDQTYGCTKEACSFRDSQADFASLNTVVLGVSVDSIKSHADFADKHAIDFPLLADTKKTVSQSYGVLLPLGIASRVTYIINPEGHIADTLTWVNWFRYGQQVAKRLRELQAEHTS